MVSALKFTATLSGLTGGTALVVRPLWGLLVELLDNVLACEDAEMNSPPCEVYDRVLGR